MSSTLPKALWGGNRSSFALIDPSTQLYYRKLNRHGLLTNSLRQHVAISYVWSEWVVTGSDGMPSWDVLRERLLFILGENASKSIRSETGGATRCWLDSKCIDQRSESSKSYWIPRMDEIYAEAKCTVLLVKDPSIAVLVPIVQGMKCAIKSKSAVLDWPHNCLLSQSCTAFPEISLDQEEKCLTAMRKLYDGAWRKRAWIFQEILLSRKYLLCLQESEFIELGDIGVIANLLFQRHLNETWLGSFADWCRRLYYLQQFYAQSRLHHLSDANVIQMATGLEATVPADKFYALCGILRLKDVPYVKSHTCDEAFKVIVSELLKKGRLSWLYAVPPLLNGHGFCLVEGNITPFLLTRLSDRFVMNRNRTHMDSSSIGFPVMCIGKVVRTKPLAELLQEAYHCMKENEKIELPQNQEYLYFAPKIIRRIALDVINPLLVDPLFGQICHGLGISKQSASRPSRAWRMILSLYIKDVASEFPAPELSNNQEDQASARLVWSAARSLQERLKILQHEFSVIWWQSDKPSQSQELEHLSLGPQTCIVGSYICALKDDEDFLVAASFASPVKKTCATEGPLEVVEAQFRGGIYDLGAVMTFQYSVKIFTISFTASPTDMLGPLFGDHPIWDAFKDTRYDKYIKTDFLETRTLTSLFGKVKQQAGRPLYLNIAYNQGPRHESEE